MLEYRYFSARVCTERARKLEIYSVAFQDCVGPAHQIPPRKDSLSLCASLHLAAFTAIWDSASKTVASKREAADILSRLIMGFREAFADGFGFSSLSEYVKAGFWGPGKSQAMSPTRVPQTSEQALVMSEHALLQG